MGVCCDNCGTVMHFSNIKIFNTEKTEVECTNCKRRFEVTANIEKIGGSNQQKSENGGSDFENLDFVDSASYYEILGGKRYKPAALSKDDPKLEECKNFG
jgi:hypothetical protein